jgi:hypothetical protein
MPHRSNQDQRAQEQGILFNGGAYVSAIRDDQFKMVYQYETGHYELYDLTNDISESINLVQANSTKAFELSAALRSYFVEVNATMPVNKLTGLNVALPPVLWPTVQGDFDGYNGIDLADWIQLRTAFGSDISQLSLITGYAAGDINLDGEINRFDFALFKSQFNQLHGAGSFEVMLAEVPEPSTAWSLVIAMLVYRVRRIHSVGGRS